jgi:hypothetical protein
MTSGILMFWFNGVDQATFENHKTIFTLVYTDVLDKSYSLLLPLAPIHDSDMQYFPGINMGLQIPTPTAAASTNASPNPPK